MRTVPKHVLYQGVSMFAMNIGELTSGVGIGYLSPFRGPIQGSLGATDVEMDWTVSAITLGFFIGCFTGGTLADKIGRKFSLMVSLLLALVGWIIVATSCHPYMPPAGRIIHGFGEGMSNVIAIMYIGEVAPPTLKGGFVASVNVFFFSGIALAYVLGMLFPWRVAGGVTAALALVGILALCIVPESPAWLSEKGKFDEALKALAKLQGPVVPQSLASLKQSSKASLQQYSVSKAEIQSPTASFKKKDFFLSSAIPPLLLFLAPISGAYSISFYAIQMLADMKIDNKDYVTLAVTGIRIVGAIISIFNINKFGRRLPMLISDLILTLASLSMAICLYFLKDDQTANGFELRICLVVLMMVSMLVNGMGVSPIPWTLCSEWPLIKHKALVNTLGSVSFYGSIFLSARMTNFLEARIGLFGLFCLFTFVSALFLLVVFLGVPETGGLTYHQFKLKEERKPSVVGQEKTDQANV